ALSEVDVSPAGTCSLSGPVYTASAATRAPALSALSLHDALPISWFSLSSSTSSTVNVCNINVLASESMETITSTFSVSSSVSTRSAEHTSELQSRFDLVCRLLLEKTKRKCEHPEHHRTGAQASRP